MFEADAIREAERARDGGFGPIGSIMEGEGGALWKCLLTSILSFGVSVNEEARGSSLDLDDSKVDGEGILTIGE